MIFVCIKVATQEDGEYVFVTTEAAYKDKKQAEDFFSNKVKSWKEVVNGVPCDCVRALHEVELN